MKINEVPNDTYVIKGGDCLPIEELRSQWKYMFDDEKEDWHTATCHRSKVEANRVIEWIIEDMTDDGYEDMDVFLRDALTDEGVAKLQVVLDELFDNEAADVYYPAEKIEVTNE